MTWHEDQKQFMLEWYIEYMKRQHAGFKFKKQHHMLCADALNKKFAMGVTVDQVDRQYRHFKENWKFVAAALSKSGNSFDHTRCLLTISESEKENLCDRARRLLSKPIKFFKEMQELFAGCSADGSLAMDQNTCMDVSDDSGSDDSRELLDLNGYTQPEDTLGEDSDTLPTSSRHPTGNNSCSSNNSRAGKKRPRGNNGLPTKKQSKNKSRLVECDDEIKDTLKSLRDMLAATAPPPMPQFTDPHASLWQRIEAIPMTPDQRILVGEHLFSNENEANDREIWDFTNALEDHKAEIAGSDLEAQGDHQGSCEHVFVAKDTRSAYNGPLKRKWWPLIRKPFPPSTTSSALSSTAPRRPFTRACSGATAARSPWSARASLRPVGSSTSSCAAAEAATSASPGAASRWPRPAAPRRLTGAMRCASTGRGRWPCGGAGPRTWSARVRCASCGARGPHACTPPEICAWGGAGRPTWAVAQTWPWGGAAKRALTGAVRSASSGAGLRTSAAAAPCASTGAELRTCRAAAA